MLGFGAAVLKWLKSPMPRKRAAEDKGALRPLLAKVRAKARGHRQRQLQRGGESLRSEAGKPVTGAQSGFGGYQILIDSGDTFQVVPLLLNCQTKAETLTTKCETPASSDCVQDAAPTNKHVEESVESISSDDSSQSGNDGVVFTPASSEEEIDTSDSLPTPTSAPAIWFGSRKDGGTIQHFEMVKSLSESHSLGNYVDIMRFRPTSDLFVVKTLRIRSNSDGRGIEPNEVLAHRGLQSHPNIVEHFGSDMSMGFHHQPALSYIFLEHCTGGDLGGFMDNWARTRSDMVPEMFVMHVLQSLISAVAYLHEGITFENGKPVKPDSWTPLIHRDIKPANVFLRWPTDGSSSKYGLPDVVLGDLGFLVKDVEGINRDLCGTPGYLPPEVEWLWDMYDDPTKVTLCNEAMDAVGGRVWRPFGDIYAIGLVVAELATMSNTRPVSGLFDSRNWRHTGIDTALWTTVGNMLSFDPRDRPQTLYLSEEARLIRGHIAFSYVEGCRMPDECWKPSVAQRRGMLSSSSYSSMSSSMSAEFIIDASDMMKFPSPPPCNGSGESAFSARSSSTCPSINVRNVDPKGDIIDRPAHCYCPNHRSISLREPGSRCFF